MLVIENCNSLSDLRQKLIDGEEVRTARHELCEGVIRRAEVIKAIDEREDVNGKVDAESVRTDIVLMSSVKPHEPCDNAISRQAVLDAIDVKAWEFCDYLISKNRNDEQKPVSHFADTLRECVREELPSVNPQSKTGHWIPVSEELPDKEGYYLCSVRYMYPPYNFFEPEKVKYMDDVTIQKFDGEFNIEVKAWMSLPAPFEPQESENKE